MISDSMLGSLKDTYKLEVKLTYFRKSGKYYSSGSYMEDYLPLFEIWDAVKKMKKHPGLNCRWKESILIEVPSHFHEHPHIIHMKECAE